MPAPGAAAMLGWCAGGPLRQEACRHDRRLVRQPGQRPAPPGFDPGVAHVARVYNYWLGGTANYPADQEAAEQAMAAYPGLARPVRANRAFLARTTRWLARDAGIRQFLDIGTGIPAPDNTHEVAQAVAPESRVVYADHDPIVLAHARSMLDSTPAGATDYLDADLREPARILAEAARTLDFGRPVAIVLMAVLQFISDEEGVDAVVAQLLDAAPPGSYLVVSHPANDIDTESMTEMASLAATADVAAGDAARPCGGGPVLRRPGAGRAGGGPDTRVAAGLARRRGHPGHHVGRGRPQALAAAGTRA